MSRTKPRPLKQSKRNGQENEVLTAAEAAAFLRASEADVQDMAATGRLPGRKIGSEWRFLKAALQSWLSKPAENPGLLNQLGKLKDDPHLEEMLREIYAQRGRQEAGAS